MSLDESTIRPLTPKIIQLMETKCIRLNGSATELAVAVLGGTR